MTNLPVSYAAAALYGLGIEAGPPDFMESYEQSEDSAREREQAEAEFRHPCPLRDLLE
jgi:hypothetical protein